MSVYDLSQAVLRGLESAGGKGANLGQLAQAGMPVPPGFVVSADEYTAFLEGFELPANSDLPSNTTAFLSKVRAHLVTRELPASLVKQLEHAVENLRETVSRTTDQVVNIGQAAMTADEPIFAVRSSATAEDLADASFAGQHETYYYVTPDNLPLMIRKCWASMWSDAAFSYRTAQGIEHRSVSMAVVVQHMIRSEVSGVTFTADPVSGDRSAVITESSWGMGAAIVDGRVSPDHYRVDKASAKRITTKISDKKFMVASTISQDESPRLIPVPANLRRRGSLNDKHLRAITTLAVKCEQHFGSPQDIEWAMADDQIYLLQSRAITTLGITEDQYPEGRYLLFKPVAENFTDPLMPLTEDLLAPMMPMMKVIRGRLYLNLDHVKALIPLKLSDENIARLAYLSSSTEENPKLSILKAALLLPLLFGIYLTMGVFSRRCADMPDDFMKGFRHYAEKIAGDNTVPVPATFVALFARFRFLEPAGNMVLLVNLVAPRYIVFLRILNGLLAHWAPALPSDAASQLCSGTKGVLSTQMGHDILELASIAKRTPGLTSIIRGTAPNEVRSQLNETPEAGNFLEAFDRFLAMHGHRALKEFELSSVRWEEDPAPVFGMIRNYLSLENDALARHSDVTSQRQATEEQMTLAIAPLWLEKRLGIRKKVLRTLIDQTRYYMKLRENSRFYHIMGFYALRKKILNVERDLLAANKLKCPDDIFFLKWSEVDRLMADKADWSDVEDTIRNRRLSHIRHSKIAPLKTVGFDITDPDSASASDQLTGQPASPGRVEGIARIIMDPATDNEIAPGEILVAPYTDPAWTPLFLTAKAAVVEVGSYLSHAGTIAREYGMPCVVDVAHCTSALRDGDLIRVDGSAGTVEKLNQEPDVSKQKPST
ncbi:MAG: phosphoenolpyruvate synthase/pyruvate phosphate dikinase [Candidatus Azotimanducaceae bacterium]|jgi:phosphoenolpyruvate synthase/pyruvate phosphate dikinase